MSVSFQNAGQEQRVDLGEEQTHVLKTSFFSCCRSVLFKTEPKICKTYFSGAKTTTYKTDSGAWLFPDKISPVLLQQAPRFNREAANPRSGWGSKPVKNRLVNYTIPELAAALTWDHTACHTVTSACLSWDQQSSPGQALSGGIGVEKYFLK